MHPSLSRHCDLVVESAAESITFVSAHSLVDLAEARGQKRPDGCLNRNRPMSDVGPKQGPYGDHLESPSLAGRTAQRPPKEGPEN
jgi:hypothetical protein